jgi:hypothetical protein
MHRHAHGRTARLKGPWWRIQVSDLSAAQVQHTTPIAAEGECDAALVQWVQLQQRAKHGRQLTSCEASFAPVTDKYAVGWSPISTRADILMREGRVCVRIMHVGVGGLFQCYSGWQNWHVCP